MGGLSGGGFESPGLGAGQFQYAPGGTPWAFTGGAGVSANGSGFTAGNPAAPDGTQVAFLQGQGSASQTVEVAAGTYTLSFRAAQRGNYNPAGSQAVRVLVDGVDRGTFTPSGSGYAAFATASFDLSAGAHTIVLEGVNGGERTALVDGVSLAAAAPNLIADGGFASPAVGTGAYGAFAYAPGGAAWTFTGGAGVAGDGSGFTAGNPAAPDGTQVAFLQGTGQLFQAVNLGAGSHTVSFQVAQRGNYNPIGGQTVIVRLDGVEVGRVTPGGSGYQTFAASFDVAASGNHVLSLEGTMAGGDSTALVDAISLI